MAINPPKQIWEWYGARGPITRVSIKTLLCALTLYLLFRYGLYFLLASSFFLFSPAYFLFAFIYFVFVKKYRFSTRWKMAMVVGLASLTFVLLYPVPGNPIPGLNSLLVLYGGGVFFVFASVIALYFPYLRWKLVGLLLVAELGLLVCDAAKFTVVSINEYPEAQQFLDEIEQLTFYDAHWGYEAHGVGEWVTTSDDRTTKTRTREDGSVVETHEYTKLSFDEARGRLRSFEISPEDTRSMFSHGKFHQSHPLWKGNFAGIAKMRDGSERKLEISTYGGFYRVKGLSVIFDFDEVGRKKWDEIDQQYREYLASVRPPSRCGNFTCSAYVCPAEREKAEARSFVENIEEVIIYDARWYNENYIVPSPSPDQKPGSRTLRRFEDAREDLKTYVIPQKQVKDMFSHVTFDNPGMAFGKSIPDEIKMSDGQIIHGEIVVEVTCPGVAKMKDGSERILHISTIEGVFSADGIGTFFGFDEIGKKEWDAILQGLGEYYAKIPAPE